MIGNYKKMKLTLKSVCVLIAFFCFDSLQAQQVQNVTLQLKWKHQFQFAGYYAAIEKGYYKELGINVNLVEAIEGQNPNDEVFSGKAEFGICSSDILLMHSQSKKAVVLATVFQHSPFILLASKQSGIENVHDLVGKRIALEPNAADIIVYMADEGVPIEKCIINPHSFDTKKLLNGEIDAISAFSTDEPFILQEANFEYTIISPSAGGIDFYGEILFTTDSLINKNPKLVSNFRKASLKGWKYAMDNRQEIIELIYNKYSKRHSLAHLQFEAEHTGHLILPDVVEIGYTNPGRWESIVETYKKRNLLSPSFTTKGLLYSDYLKPKANIPWKLIAIFSLIVVIIGSIALFFYKVSAKLKKEIENRIKAEMQIKKLSIAIEQSPTTILITDIKGNIEYVNPKFMELTGYSIQEVKGKDTRILKSGKTDKKTIKELWQTITSGKIWQGEFINRKKGGDEFIESALIAPIFDQIGTIINYIAIKEDVTEKKRQEELIKQKNIQLAELNATKDKFFSIIAHDLRNPFSGILGFSDLLVNSTREYSSQEISQYAGFINQAAQNAYKLLENLLEWARAQTGKIEFKPLETDLNKLVLDIISLLENSAKAKNISINNQVSANLFVFADVNMLNTILRNLITNAIKFTQTNGQITLSSLVQNNEVIITVSDTGVGIDSDTLAKLFNISEKVSHLGTNDEKGTGLGLLLCKEFVLKHGGKIWVESELGKGSDFKFSLPCVDAVNSKP